MKLIKDEIWSVRDAACSASGYVYAAFPDECDELYEQVTFLWFLHLSENTFTARHHSAQSLAKVFDSVEKVRDDLETRIANYLNENILKAKE